MPATRFHRDAPARRAAPPARAAHRKVATIVVGGGQAGLAISRCLTDRGHDHVVLERGRIGERWRSERWDSLRLLTPNWMSRLPGYAYRGPDPDGFMSKADVVDLLARYARSFAAPVEEGTAVRTASPTAEGWRVETDRGTWSAHNLVVATGACDTPWVPDAAAGLDRSIRQVTTTGYRSPAALPPGGVLVVGASATGAQLADELRRAGREVVLAAGNHNRLVRTYRGRDVMWWLDRTGVLDRRVEDLRDPSSGRGEPSLQLVGRPGGSVDLGALRAAGIGVAGRLVAADGRTVRFDRQLRRRVAAADLRLRRLLERFDRWADAHGLSGELPPAEPVAPVVLPDDGPAELDLDAAGIRTVLWAVGFRRSYPWLPAAALDGCGEIRHRRGHGELPGLYALGLQFMTRRRSSFLDGVGRDAEEIAVTICGRATDPSSLAA